MDMNGFVCLAGDSLQETGGAGDGGCYEKSGQVCHRWVKRTGPHALQTGQSGQSSSSVFMLVRTIIRLISVLCCDCSSIWSTWWTIHWARNWGNISTSSLLSLRKFRLLTGRCEWFPSRQANPYIWFLILFSVMNMTLEDSLPWSWWLSFSRNFLRYCNTNSYYAILIIFVENNNLTLSVSL